MSEHEEENYRHGNYRGERDRGGQANTRRGENGSHFGAVEGRDGEPSGDPNKTTNAGGDIRSTRRPVAQRLQNLSDAGAVIIGGAPGRGIAGRPARWCFWGE